MQTTTHDAQPTAWLPAQDTSTVAPTTTLFVESELPPLLLPRACQQSDAALDYPTQIFVPMPVPTTQGSQDECGNSRHQEYESCDDGNRDAGDGCNGSCQIEPFYICETGGRACVRLPICGDGVLAADEACDDGNLVASDGCSPSCQNEGVGQGYCGDGIVQSARGELCDRAASNFSEYSGCTEVCTLAARCGDALVQSCGNETCDDGNRVGGDGCAANCRQEQLWVR